jgi:hypothetical protein
MADSNLIPTRITILSQTLLAQPTMTIDPWPWGDVMFATDEPPGKFLETLALQVLQGSYTITLAKQDGSGEELSLDEAIGLLTQCGGEKTTDA